MKTTVSGTRTTALLLMLILSPKIRAKTTRLKKDEGFSLLAHTFSRLAMHILIRALLINITFLTAASNLVAQTYLEDFHSSQKAGFIGEKNDDYPDALHDYQELIGINECESITRAPDGSWGKPMQAIWKFKYILGGTSIQDETWVENGRYTSSIRQFNPDSSKWYVTFFSSAPLPGPPPVWSGEKRSGDSFTLFRPQKAPNGMDGYSRLTFYDIHEDSFKWIGEWVNERESVEYPTWKIECTKKNYSDTSSH